VVWFGEALDPEVLSEAFQAAREADLCLVVGTSALVHPAASVPLATLDRGGVIIEVNPTETPLTHLAAVSLRGGSGDLLPNLVEGMTGTGT
jgi:NAD-dependent deacetylase